MPRGVPKNGPRRCSPRVERVRFPCEECGKEIAVLPSFLRQHPTTRFCSRKCMGMANRKADSYVETDCSQCGKRFTKRRDHLKPRNYCSPTCSHMARQVITARWRDKSQIRRYLQSYSKKNREHLNVMSRRWVRANPEKRKESRQRYEAAHKEALTVLRHLRRGRVSEGTLTGEQWHQVLVLCEFKCLACGRGEPSVMLTLDHIQPLSLGGSHSVENVQPLCKSCNSKKGTKAIDYRPKKLVLALHGVDVEEV